ncbi:MAG: hypothetical protein EP341_09585 [Sphingomonadales bacterium]|nr:MAG: hypothetical protein EP341_09585 [Sphingomonadales bacterium]
MIKFVLAAIVAITGGAAFAAPNCATTLQVHDILTSKYGEAPIARGLDSRGNMIEWWGNAETGSWTVIGTSPDGTSCILGQGGNFVRIALAPNL